MIFDQINTKATTSVIHEDFPLEAAAYPQKEDSHGDSHSQNAQFVDDPCHQDDKAEP